MVIFLYNLYIFVWIQHSCLNKMVFTLDPSNSFIQRLCCIMSVVSKCVKIYLMESFSTVSICKVMIFWGEKLTPVQRITTEDNLITLKCLSLQLVLEDWLRRSI